MLLWLFIIGLLLCAFLFSKTTKECPKSWYEWKTEFRYQYLGIVGLIHDAQYAARDRVGRYNVFIINNSLMNLLAIKSIYRCHYLT